MNRMLKATAVAALCCTVAGTGYMGVAQAAGHDGGADGSTARATHAGHGDRGDSFVGEKKISVEGRSVNVSCAGRQSDRKPVVVLVAGLGDGLDAMADLQRTLSEKNRVCSYDRLGEGGSDKPEGPQSMADTGRVLTGVINRVSGDSPVVLAGHSLGGLIAARYAPDHRDKVKGLVLMDATSSTTTADVTRVIPESATGDSGDLRAQSIAVMQGQNPENLVVPDGKVRSAGWIPTQVLRHGQQYLAQFPTYGPQLEADWTKGQYAWAAVSHRSTIRVAENSGHYIYVDRKDIAVKSIQRVAAEVTQRNGGWWGHEGR
ncbi:pimeloyl-ACP methyl ester carboxylesterase [Streptomyces sp. B3I7]|uniref:alpha/beta fold hydrolase n=1 Tax=Streptomyces sp. B3I7 TaxID=3042269 RepID=UPI00278921F2|nr:alpha/beta hydrolase family protein [Streptomyces sp. B3I7]MDQ0811947.1 pimeloyl-ACP methyl ester carboxylesterase [Streptomyces sp. B3I7]